jgi:hypothetical protein
MPWYGWIWEQADTFCRNTWTGFAQDLHLKVRKRAGLAGMEWEIKTRWIKMINEDTATVAATIATDEYRLISLPGAREK